jgi:hypothetical protein
MHPGNPQANALEPSSPPLPSWLLLLGSGLVAGLLATAGGEFTLAAIHPDFQYPAHYETLSAAQKTVVRGQVRFQARSAAETKRSAASFGLLGGALGALLGIAGGLAAGSTGSSVRGAVVGGVWGGAAGVGLSRLLVPAFFEGSDLQTGVVLLLLTHMAIFALIGAAAGMALATGLADGARNRRSMIGGLVGALVGTVLADVTNFIAFPLFRMYEPVPVKLLPRLILNLGIALAVALGAGLAARKRRRQPDAPQAAR